MIEHSQESEESLLEGENLKRLALDMTEGHPGLREDVEELFTDLGKVGLSSLECFKLALVCLSRMNRERSSSSGKSLIKQCIELAERNDRSFGGIIAELLTIGIAEMKSRDESQSASPQVPADQPVECRRAAVSLKAQDLLTVKWSDFDRNSPGSSWDVGTGSLDQRLASVSPTASVVKSSEVVPVLSAEELNREREAFIEFLRTYADEPLLRGIVELFYIDDQELVDKQLDTITYYLNWNHDEIYLDTLRLCEQIKKLDSGSLLDRLFEVSATRDARNGILTLIECSGFISRFDSSLNPDQNWITNDPKKFNIRFFQGRKILRKLRPYLDDNFKGWNGISDTLKNSLLPQGFAEPDENSVVDDVFEANVDVLLSLISGESLELIEGELIGLKSGVSFYWYKRNAKDQIESVFVASSR